MIAYEHSSAVAFPHFRMTVSWWVQLGSKLFCLVLVPTAHGRVSEPLSLDKGSEPYLSLGSIFKGSFVGVNPRIGPSEVPRG
jgi:hypothetical protein